MRTFCKVTMLLALVAFMATPALAQQGKKKRRGKRPPRTPLTQLTKQLKTLDLTAEQKEKAETILKSVKEKVTELAAKGKITPEQRKAMAEARKKGQADGLKGPALQKSVMKAAGLTEDQQKSLQELQKFMRDLRTKIVKELQLTPEQVKKAKLRGRQGGHKGRKKKNG